MTHAQEAALDALRTLRADIDSQIASGLTGEPDKVIEEFARSYNEALAHMVGLFPDDATEDWANDETSGPVLTIRTRADYVIEDEARIRGDSATLGDAVYELLHDQGEARYTEVPGARLAIALTSVHTSETVTEIPLDDTPASALLAIDPEEQELRGIIDIW